MELTKTKLNNILKKYRLELVKLNKDWEETCRKVRLRSTDTQIALPTIYEHESHNSKGNQLFKNMMKEFEGYEVFPKKVKEKNVDKCLCELNAEGGSLIGWCKKHHTDFI